jgi:uncharacterized protein (DUF433 family)
VSTITDTALAEMLAYCEAATEGPWRRYGLSGITSKHYDIANEYRYHCDECGAEASVLPFNRPDDADFCTAARTDLPAVIRELQALRERDAARARVAGDTAMTPAETVRGVRHLKLPNAPGIVSTPDTCWGRTRFDGTRLPIYNVLSTMAGGDSEAEAMENYGVTREQMTAMYALCLQFVRRLP